MTEAEIDTLILTMTRTLHVALPPQNLAAVRASFQRLAECAEMVATPPRLEAAKRKQRQ